LPYFILSKIETIKKAIPPNAKANANDPMAIWKISNPVAGGKGGLTPSKTFILTILVTSFNLNNPRL
jgi:hypothetical protein